MMSFQEKHYEFIEDLNLEMGIHLAVQSFKNLIRVKHKGVTVNRVVEPNDIYLYMEPVLSILHRDFFVPFAEKINSRNKENTIAGELVIEGLCLIHQKKHPIIIRDMLNSYIPPALRKSSEE